MRKGTIAEIETTSGTSRAASGAWGAASDAAAAAAVDVMELHEPEVLREVEELFVRVWSTDRRAAPVSADLLRALSHSGNYVAGAFADGGELIGASVAIIGLDGRALKLHSHITGMSRESQAKGAGYAIKLHQRAWAIDRGFERISWTFDPLVRRNAYFNLAKLGGEITNFFVNFYGRMDDGVNAGDESDRCEVTWSVTSQKAVEASAGRVSRPDVRALLDKGARVILDEGSNGGPDERDIAGEIRLCRVPDDIVAIRAAAPEVAARWRLALRNTLGASIFDGFVASAVTSDGWYVLNRANSPQGSNSST